MAAQSVAFDRAAGFYDETRGFPPGEVGHIAQMMVTAGGLTADSRVCEAGIGTGRIALPLAAHVRLVTGVDLARPMLARLLDKRTGEPCHPLIGDATRLPFAANTFDAALAVHVFHLIPNYHDALREIARVLRPGGVLLQGWNDITRDLGTPVDLFPIWAAASGLEQQDNVGLPRAQYETFLRDSGWQQVGPRRTHTYTLKRTVRDFIDRLERRVWSSSWHLADEQVARGVAAVRAAIAEHAIPLDKPLPLGAAFHVEAYTPPA